MVEAQQRRQPNTLLRQARLTQQSQAGSGRSMSRRELAEAVNAHLHRTTLRTGALDSNYIGKLERGIHRWPNEEYRRAFRSVLHASADADLGFFISREMAASQTDSCSSTHTASTSATATFDRFGRIEDIRQDLDIVLSQGMMSEASLDNWERATIRYGRATRSRPASVILDDLGADLAELNQSMHAQRAASTLRRLSRVAAQLSGLICLTLCKLDDRSAFRRWARTARMAAFEAGDPETQAWVLAQEAHGHYYSRDPLEAVEVAQHAQDVVRARPCVGAALAAALEARAFAALGHQHEAHRALARAEEITAHLDGEALAHSAFGYNEGQLRFHASSVFTHLRMIKPAFAAQERALELCAPGDYTDWALTRLDHACCLALAHETEAALAYAIETLTSLTEPQRSGIITLRGHAMLESVPKQHQQRQAARELHELLMLTTDDRKVAGP